MTTRAAWPWSWATSPPSPPKSNRHGPWTYDAQRYRQRNQIEHLFGRFKRFRRVGTRYNKLDLIFLSGISWPLIRYLLASM